MFPPAHLLTLLPRRSLGLLLRLLLAGSGVPRSTARPDSALLCSEAPLSSALTRHREGRRAGGDTASPAVTGRIKPLWGVCAGGEARTKPGLEEWLLTLLCVRSGPPRALLCLSLPS
ncbi:hypothetical protein E2C01_062896 [Portunus trituberculatus]|uniref:Secreted protein n=1 Tax=Portunus trituberculatus TaxID=210409 RepID=A0A5B7HCD3_PORTR|nr:hypothetical protein [Portunus trituberculatus]